MKKRIHTSVPYILKKLGFSCVLPMFDLPSPSESKAETLEDGMVYELPQQRVKKDTKEFSAL